MLYEDAKNSQIKGERKLDFFADELELLSTKICRIKERPWQEVCKLEKKLNCESQSWGIVQINQKSTLEEIVCCCMVLEN